MKNTHARKIIVLRFHVNLLTLHIVILDKVSLLKLGSLVCKVLYYYLCR
jgi:hypothetical protein